MGWTRIGGFRELQLPEQGMQVQVPPPAPHESPPQADRARQEDPRVPRAPGFGQEEDQVGETTSRRDEYDAHPVFCLFVDNKFDYGICDVNFRHTFKLLETRVSIYFQKQWAAIGSDDVYSGDFLSEDSGRASGESAFRLA